MVPRDVAQLFPHDEYLPKGAVGYAGYPLKDAAGRVAGIIAIISRQAIEDAALVESVLKIFAVRAAAELERRTHEEALAASEANYRAIFEAAEDAIFILDCERGAILDANAKACSTYGYTREELRHVGAGDISGHEPPYTNEDMLRLIAEVRAGRGPLRFEWLRRNRDGSLDWDEVTLKKVDIAGKPRILAMTREITERKSAVEALRASEEQYRAIFNASADSLVLRDAEFRVVDVNPAYEAMSGRRREEALGRSDLTMSPPELTARVKQLHARALAGERVVFEALARRKDGSRFNIETRGVPILHKGEPHVLYIGRDITARKTEEELLRASEEQYRAIFDASEDALILWNSELQRVDVNPAYERIYGFSREEVLQGVYADNVPPEYVERRRETVRRTLAGERCHFELESVRKDGTPIHVEVRTIPIQHRGKPHVLAIARDVSGRRAAEAERAQLEKQLRQAQKMEAIGHLTGGIAHDFNNILQSILGNLTLAAERTEALDDAKLARALERAQISAQRARELIVQMLTFSRGRRGEARLLSLPQLVGEAAKLLRPALPSTIELRTELAAQVSAVRADPVQVEQVLLNLAINARDAMAGAGLIALAVREARHAGAVCSSCRQKFSGGFVELSVHDTGCGISADVRRPHVRAVLLHQGRGQGQRHGPRDGARHRPRARRPHPGRHRAQPGRALSHRAARGARRERRGRGERARRQGKRPACRQRARGRRRGHGARADGRPPFRLGARGDAEVERGGRPLRVRGRAAALRSRAHRPHHAARHGSRAGARHPPYPRRDPGHPLHRLRRRHPARGPRRGERAHARAQAGRSGGAVCAAENLAETNTQHREITRRRAAASLCA